MFDTVIVKLAGTAGLPARSVALHVIVVVPTGKFEPDDRPAVGDDVQVTVTVASMLSVALTAKLTGTLAFGVITEMLFGTVITGGAQSRTVTVE